jgi:uncharacterized linocin/CFP29 family protein
MLQAHSDIEYLLYGGGSSPGGIHSPGLPASVAQKLLKSNFDPRVLRTNDILVRNEWIAYDNAVIEIARARLNTVAAFINAGLTYDLPNAMGKPVIAWRQTGDIDPAEVAMDPVTRAQKDKPDAKLVSMPIPIIHKEFMVSIRELATSRLSGDPLDVSMASLAGRKVAEKVESIIWNGVTMGNVNGGVVRGILTDTARNTAGFGTNGAWSAAAKTGANILADIDTMTAALRGDHYFGPYTLFIPADAETKLDQDYTTTYAKTIRNRILENSQIKNIVVSDALPTANVVLMQMSRDVFDLVIGMQPTTVQWETLGGLEQNFKVMAIILPRTKSDYSGQSGIFHMA